MDLMLEILRKKYKGMALKTSSRRMATVQDFVREDSGKIRGIVLWTRIPVPKDHSHLLWRNDLHRRINLYFNIKLNWTVRDKNEIIMRDDG